MTTDTRKFDTDCCLPDCPHLERSRIFTKLMQCNNYRVFLESAGPDVVRAELNE